MLNALKTRFKKPTPAKWRKIGNAMFISSMAGAGISAYNEHKWMIGLLVVLAVMGKFLAELATED